MRTALLNLIGALYAGGLRPLIFRATAQDAHERMMGALRRADRAVWLYAALRAIRRAVAPPWPVEVGGVRLDSPLILAAGLVKGDGFASEEAALAAARGGQNIMPGWRAIPAIAGLVEFGSFTRWPRMGNPGVVMWRDEATGSTQNRVGLKNPGAAAAAEFLAARGHSLPPRFGINIAVSPGVDDPDRQVLEVLESLAAFVVRGVTPAWFTLNLSCPNTEDDPGGNQTADLAGQVCGAAVDYLRTVAEDSGAPPVPLWVKVGPDLSADQYRALMRTFARVGVRAVVATNTLGMPSPDDPSLTAGVGGGRLHEAAVQTAALLLEEQRAAGGGVDVLGCGGVADGATCADFFALGAPAVQYWTALVYRGPLAAALIAGEARALTKEM